MRDFLQKQIEYLTTDHEGDGYAVADDCRLIIDDIKALAIEAGLPAMVELTEACNPTRPAVRMLLASCVELCPVEAEPVRDWLLVSEVAERLRVSANKVLGWIRDGQLQAMNVNSGGRPSYRIKIDAIDHLQPIKLPPPKQSRK